MYAGITKKFILLSANICLIKLITDVFELSQVQYFLIVSTLTTYESPISLLLLSKNKNSSNKTFLSGPGFEKLIPATHLSFIALNNSQISNFVLSPSTLETIAVLVTSPTFNEFGNLVLNEFSMFVLLL